MKKIYKNSFTLCLAFACISLSAQTTVFNYTGGLQTYSVPVCVTSITVDVMGAKGGDNGAYIGGLGGRVQATIPVTPGELLYIYVGQGGVNASVSNPGVYNGGGGVYSYVSAGTAGTGGGGSDIRRAPFTTSDRIAVAGGGGGGGYQTVGGNGGGLIGQDGVPYPTFLTSGGKGGTQSAGGAMGIACCSCPTYTTNGAFFQGGNGSGDGAGGGGGGGGWYGGGGSCFAGGGGGSSYTVVGATGVVHTQGYQNGNGQIVITGNTGVPNTGAITGSSTICAGASGTYSIVSMPGATSYTWTVPAGSTINSGQGTNSINITAGATSGNISVTATFPCGTSAPTTFALTINPSPTVGFTVSPSTSVCAGNSVTLNGTGATSYFWTGGVLNGVSFVPVSTTTYTLTGTAAGCWNTATVTVTVNPLPTITFFTTTPSICSGDVVTLWAYGATTYAWMPGSLTGNVVFDSPTTTTTYTVTGTDANGCQNIGLTTITVNPLPNVSASANSSTICNGSSVILTAAGATTYTWMPGSLTGSPVTDNPNVTTTYTVMGRDANSCSDTATISITVNPLPTVTATSSADTVCAGSSVMLTGGGATSYTWDNSVVDGISFVPTSTNTYLVTGTDGNGCMNTSSITVTVNPIPAVTGAASSSIVCVDDAPVTLTGTPAGGLWTGPGVTGTSFDPSSAGVGAQSINYSYTDANGCEGIAFVSIQVNACVGVVESTLANGMSVFPNPNNGTFTLSIASNVGDVSIAITDLQGRVVYSSNETNVKAGFSKQISLENESSGMYLLHITANGEQSTAKISVQR